jgi:hypothetical protein
MNLSVEEQNSPLLHRKQIARRLEPDSTDDIPALARDTVSFSTVRHPFERLVSAYINKVLPPCHARMNKLYIWICR